MTEKKEQKENSCIGILRMQEIKMLRKQKQNNQIIIIMVKYK